MIPSNKQPNICVHACARCLIVLVWYVFALTLLRLARWCAAGWFVTATTLTPTCSAAPSATLDWAASVCTRTACSPTAVGTHGWRTASSASAWWVLTRAWTRSHSWNFHRINLVEAFIRSQLPQELEQHSHSCAIAQKCNKYSSLHGNAHEWEMCSVKKVKEKRFFGKDRSDEETNWKVAERREWGLLFILYQKNGSK